MWSTHSCIARWEGFCQNVNLASCRGLATPRPDARSKIPMTSTRHPPPDSSEGAQAPLQAKWSRAHLSRVCYRECFFGVRLETKVQIGCDHHLSVVEAWFSHDFGGSALQVPMPQGSVEKALSFFDRQASDAAMSLGRTGTWMFVG